MPHPFLSSAFIVGLGLLAGRAAQFCAPSFHPVYLLPCTTVPWCTTFMSHERRRCSLRGKCGELLCSFKPFMDGPLENAVQAALCKPLQRAMQSRRHLVALLVFSTIVRSPSTASSSDSLAAVSGSRRDEGAWKLDNCRRPTATMSAQKEGKGGMAGRLSKLMSTKASPRAEAPAPATGPAAPAPKPGPVAFGRDPRLSKYIAQRVFNRPEVSSGRRGAGSSTARKRVPAPLGRPSNDRVDGRNVIGAIQAPWQCYTAAARRLVACLCTAGCGCAGGSPCAGRRHPRQRQGWQIAAYDASAAPVLL